MSVDIKNIKKNLINRYPFFGSIIDSMEYIKTQNCTSNGVPTAGTNGKTIYYHPDIDKLSEKQQLFLFAHEICHVAFEHKKRGEGKDPKIWNYATDAVINAHLKKDGLELIDNVVDLPWAIKYDAEEVYERLLKESKKNEEEFKNGGHDDHDLWNEDTLSNNDSPIDEVTKKFAEMKEKEVLSDKDKQKVKKILQEVKKAIEKYKSQSKKGLSKQSGIGIEAGSTTNEETVKFDNIGFVYPLVNWPLILKRPTEIVELDWSYRNASLEDGVMLSHLDESLHVLQHLTEIVLDTSGSIDDELLKTFLRECKNILNFSKLKVGCFDTKFYGFTEIRTISDIERLTFKGRGGTDFDAAINAFTETANNKVIFTDGEAYMPSKKIDAIWIVFGDEEIHPNGGKVIYIDKKRLDEAMGRNQTLESSQDNNILIRSVRR